VKDCKFCRLGRNAERDFGNVVAFHDAYPVTEDHWLVIPRQHKPDVFTLDFAEWTDTQLALDLLRAEVLREDPSVLGFNVGWNCGEVAGQTVMHAHMHIIPRRAGDVEDSFGGIRGVIPERRRY
jgi:diadenosine tetraphosphate (Ap4A) HIT family hydrolase